MAADDGIARPGPVRTWRPMLLWTAGILLALGLAWFVGAVAVPVWQLRSALEQYEERLGVTGRFTDLCCEPVTEKKLDQPKRTAALVALYVKLPEFLAPRKGCAVYLLPNCGRPAVPILAGILRHRDAHLRCVAARGLSMLGAEAASAAPALVRALGDPEDDVSDMAKKALENIGAPAVPTLLRTDAAKGGDKIDFRASWVLARIGERAVPQLTQALADSSPVVRRNAARALGDIGKGYEAQVPAIAALLRDEDESVRFYAAQALERLGPAAAPAVPALVAAMVWEKEDGAAFCGPIFALEAIGAPAVPPLVRILEERPGASARLRAVWALEGLGPAAAPAEPQLTRALADEDGAVRSAAAEALRKIRGEPEDVQPRP